MLRQGADQAEEGDPDGDPQEQGDQRRPDSPEQRAAAAAEGTLWNIFLEVCVCSFIL